MSSDRRDPFPAVQGRCPSCRSESSLFLGSGGYVTCARIDCPSPDLASELLSPAGQDATSRRRTERDFLMAELLRQEHEALRWENPHDPPEWTRRLRERLGIGWVPGCCATCSTTAPRFYRDYKRWPRLHGWTPSPEDVAEAAFLTGSDPAEIETAAVTS
jgi:hypothetical protein